MMDGATLIQTLTGGVVEAASRADVPCIGLRCGSTSQAELEKAGAVAVFDDPADLLDLIDTTPIATLPRRS